LREDQNADNDAFLMTIGDCLIVDFSISGGCYVYPKGTHNFTINDKFHYATTNRNGLKAKYRTDKMDFAHTPGWTDYHRAPKRLRQYGIAPDGSRMSINSTHVNRNINIEEYFEKSFNVSEQNHSIDIKDKSFLNSNQLVDTSTMSVDLNLQNSEIPIFTNQSVSDVPTINTSSLNKLSRSSFTQSKLKGKLIAREYGIECEDLNSQFVVKYKRINGPLADKLANIGFEYSLEIGWVLK